jgi:uncharacterized membrane protein YdjX (TVP38/TMEM64 family)
MFTNTAWWCHAGLTTIELWQYVLVSWAGMLPGTFAYVYLGSVGKETLAAGSGMPPAKLAVFGVHLCLGPLGTCNISGPDISQACHLCVLGQEN